MTATPVPSPRGREHLRVLSAAGEDLHGAVRDLHARYGDAFTFGFGPIRFAWFVGRDAARTVLLEEADAFSQRGGYDFLRPVGGATALIHSDEPEHKPRRRAVQPAFHGREVGAWLARGEAELGPWFERVARRGETVDLYRDLRPRLVRVIAGIVLGDAPLARDDAWLRDVNALMDFPGRPMLEQQWKVPLPGTPWARFVAARRRVDAALHAELARREAAFDVAAPRDGVSGGALDLLMAQRDTEGRPALSRQELRDQSLSLISAGFDTTSAALAWAVQLAFEHPDAGRDLRHALHDVSPADAQGVPALDRYLKEVLRVRPPAAAVLRRTTRPVRIAGTDVPAGRRVALSVLLTHRDPRLYDAPDAFRPDRFAGAPPDPFGYLPFGYGARYCIGAGTSTALVKAGLALLFGRYDVEPVDPRPRRPVGMTLQPEGGLPVRLRPRRD
ncbi:MAG: cytochrome P450 [Trueperaceae bacterium]|nr:cytochrome P450 [Trueperaceae bacterium]